MTSNNSQRAKMLSLFFLSSCFGATQDKEPIREEAEEAQATELIGNPLASVTGFSGKRPAYITQDVVQYYEFGYAFNPEDGTHFVVHNGPPYATRGSLVEPIVTESFEFTASFDIVAVTAKTRDHYYIAGYDGHDDVVEKWKKANVATPGGSSGSYVMKRAQLLRGDMGRIEAIAVDHLARFVLIVHGGAQKIVSRMSLPGGGAVTQVVSASQVPELAASVFSLFPRKHAAEGIIWTLEAPFPLPNGVRDYILLYDGEDDGVINNWLVLSDGDYFGLYSTFSSQWMDWFMSD